MLVTLHERTIETVHGEPVKTFAPVVEVWASITRGTERQIAALGRLEHPVERMATISPHPAAVAGNRISRGGVFYDILGVDDTGEQWHLGLARVIRGA